MIEFKYNDKTYWTTNLNKKLKRLKINQEDIEIINITDDNIINNKEKEEKEEYNDWLDCYFFDLNSKCSHIVISKDHKKPNKDILYKYIFNNKLRTGIKGFTKNYIDNLILLDGIPEFPINIDKETNLPILKIKYEWK